MTGMFFAPSFCDVGGCDVGVKAMRFSPHRGQIFVANKWPCGQLRRVATKPDAPFVWSLRDGNPFIAPGFLQTLGAYGTKGL